MAITTKQQRQQRRNEALKLISDGVPPTDAATQLSQTWGCSRRTSLREIEIAQSELANALHSIELQQMVGWLATQYQRLAAKAERDGQYAAACGCLNSLRVMLVQPQLDRQFEAHFRGRFTHQVHRHDRLSVSHIGNLRRSVPSLAHEQNMEDHKHHPSFGATPTSNNRVRRYLAEQ